MLNLSVSWLLNIWAHLIKVDSLLEEILALIDFQDFYPPPKMEACSFVHVCPAVFPSIWSHKLLTADQNFLKLKINMFHYNGSFTSSFVRLASVIQELLPLN